MDAIPAMLPDPPAPPVREEIRQLRELRDWIIEAEHALTQLCERLNQARTEIDALQFKLDQSRGGE